MQDDIKEKVSRYLINETDFLRVKDGMSEDQLRLFVNNALSDMCREQKIQMSPEHRSILIGSLVSGVVSLGPIRPLMEDKGIAEIMINGPHEIYIQKYGHIEKTDIKFDNDRHLMHTIQKLLSGSGSNKRVDESSPYVDFSLQDGSRVNVILPPCALIGPVMTIRKFNDEIATVDNLIELQMIDKKIATLLTSAMKAKLNVIFCGSTGAGKTTMLNVFSRHIPEGERIITIEDTPELHLLQEHVVSLQSKPANIEGRGEITMRELFVNSLRMRPDRIIIGEIRGEEMLDLVQSISSGHSGSLAIVHAETPEDCFNRMVTMMLMTGIRLSTEEIQNQVSRAIDLIVHIELFLDGRRRVTAVTEPEYLKVNKQFNLHNIFEWTEQGVSPTGEIQGFWKMDTKRTPSFMHKFAKKLVKLPEGFFEQGQ